MAKKKSKRVLKHNTLVTLLIGLIIALAGLGYVLYNGYSADSVVNNSQCKALSSQASEDMISVGSKKIIFKSRTKTYKNIDLSNIPFKFTYIASEAYIPDSFKGKTIPKETTKRQDWTMIYENEKNFSLDLGIYKRDYQCGKNKKSYYFPAKPEKESFSGAWWTKSSLTLLTKCNGGWLKCYGSPSIKLTSPMPYATTNLNQIQKAMENYASKPLIIYLPDYMVQEYK